MPLLTSPIDGSPMRQINRYGIEIDVCPTSGGVWLDKGELEKIMHLLQEDGAAQSFEPSRPQKQYHTDRHDHDRHHDDDDDRRYKQNGYYGSGKYHKKESKMSRFMDLFDF